MKFKKIMLVTLALLAILTISSVSAIDDTLAEENTDELSQGLDALEAVEQSISDGDADDALSYEASEFNVYINESMDLADEYASAVTFDVPSGAEGDICVYINSPETNWCYELDKSPLTLDDLNIYSAGTYSINVSFIPNEGIELPLASGTINVVKSLTASDFYNKKNYAPYISMTDEEIFELEESPAAGNLLIYVEGNLTYNHAVLKGASLLVYDYDVGIYAKKGEYHIGVKFNTTDGKIVSVEDYDLDYDVDGLSDDFDSSYYYTSSYAPLTNQSDMVFRLLSSPMSGTLAAFVNGTKVYETAVSKGWPEFIHVSDMNITKAGLYYVEVNFTGANGKEYLLQAFDLYYNPNTFVLIKDMVDVSYPDAYVAYINDPDLLNGTVMLYIDGKEYFKKTFNATQSGARIYIADLNLSDEFTGNYTVKVTYNNLSNQTQVSFKYIPYFIQPYDVAIGDASFIIFKGAASFKGTASIYNAVYNNETRSYDITTLIGTYPISDAKRLVPIPILTEEGYHVFCANYTVDGDNYSELFRVWAFENSPEFTLSTSAARINVTDSVTVKVTGPAVGGIDFYINGEWDRTFSLANGTVEYVRSNFAQGQYLITAMFSGSINYSYLSSFQLSVGLDAGNEPDNATGNGTDSGNATGTDPDENSTAVTADITNAAVTLSSKSFTFNSKVQKPLIKSIGGETLVEGTDYVVVWSNPSSKNAGTYTITITGKESYSGTAKATYTINKAANPLAVKAKTANVKYSNLKKKTQTLAVSKVVTFSKKGQGTMTYTKVSGSKQITINKKTGKVTIKKGLKKGTYKVKIKIKAGGNANYKASAYKTVTFKIVVK